MKISILSYDLSHNCLGRAYLLAKILQKKHDVEIIGPILGEGIWEPVKQDKSIKYKIINKKFDIKEIFSLIDGEIIYAVKPKGTSFGYALLKKLRSKKPLILDIDDWEWGFFLNDNLLSICLNSAHFWDINNAIYTLFLEKLTKYADSITVSNSFLQKRFGGIIIPHVRDTDLLNPKNYDRTALRRKLKIGNKKVVMFFGTIRKHKGVDDLINAFGKLKKKNIILMFVGADFEDDYVKGLINQNKKVIFIGKQPFEKMPEFLSIADIMVIPQKYSKSSVGQMPAKLFDAMAMAKPIISTKVSDIPKVLKNCGIVINPDDVNILSEKINYLLDNPKIAKELGRKARERCVKEYSFKAIEPKLFKIFEKYEKEIKDEK